MDIIKTSFFYASFN